MKNDSKVIRDIEDLNLSEKAKRLAYQLIDKIDMQVVFQVDSEGDKNYAGRHPEMKNQFWVTVTRQVNQNEYERLILTNLYRGIQEKQRYCRAWFESEYLWRLHKKGDASRIDSYIQLIGMINSIVTSFEIEMYLEKNGILTDFQVLLEKVSHAEADLKKYLNIRKNQPMYRWYRECEVSNLLEIGNLCRRNKSFQKRLTKLISQINPMYVSYVFKVKEIFREIKKEYTVENGAELNEKMLKKILELFHLNDIVKLHFPFVKKGEIKVEGEKIGELFSFVPEDYPQHEVLVQWLREASICIETIREASMFKLPDVELQLSNVEEKNAYANGNFQTGYYICFSVGLILNVIKKVNEYEIKTERESIENFEISVQAFRQFLLRFTIFYMTAHEYAHILNGDCENERYGNDRQKERENKADCCARNLVNNIIPFLYRTHPKEEDRVNEFGQYLSEGKYGKVLSIIEGLSEQRKKEIDNECCELMTKINRDRWFLSMAVNLTEVIRKENVLQKH